MPTISVDKAALFKELGRRCVKFCFFIGGLVNRLIHIFHSYTTEEFDELCFEFGRFYVRRRLMGLVKADYDE